MTHFSFIKSVLYLNEWLVKAAVLKKTSKMLVNESIKVEMFTAYVIFLLLLTKKRINKMKFIPILCNIKKNVVYSY